MATACSIGYMTGWADGNTDPIRATAARVLAAAHQLAAILIPEETEAEAAA